MRCSKCGAENPDRAKFCVECGSPFVLRCPSCNSENPQTAKFCLECAKPLEGARGKSHRVPDAGSPVHVNAGTADSFEGERKTVTMLFADIKGSMDLIEDLDPEEARAIVDPALKLMMEAVQHYGGYVAQSTGDGIFALFGAPVADEDHPQRALHSALRMQDELKRYSGRIRAEGRLPVQARVGVNTGEVVVRSITTGEGRTEYAPVGHSAGIAARMQSLAPVGSIAATGTVRKLCEGYFVFKSLGPTKVKGVSEPVNVYEVVGPGLSGTHFQLSARRGLTKFVGREEELAWLKRAFQLAKSGSGQAVAIVAEAGTGKSRLAYEFKAAILNECKLLEAYSVSHGHASPWLPVIEFLRGYFDLKDADDAKSRRDKVRAMLAGLDSALADALPYLWNLLAIHEEPDPLSQMDAQIKHQRTLEAVKRIILRESLNRPVVIVFEDLHWIDAETQALLDLLVDSIFAAPVLILVDYRPEYGHGWGNKSYYSQLRLQALDEQTAGDMLDGLLSSPIASPVAGEEKVETAITTPDELVALKRLIVEKTEGNPFFIEEMLQALFDEGALVRNGSLKVVRSLGQARLPPTVQGILAARIDRQPAEHKQLLQTLAVIGKEAPLALIKRLSESTGLRTEGILSDLQTGEFIFEQLGVNDARYVFKHALTQEVAYGSLLMEHRKQLHERTGQALESIFSDRLNDYLNHLAHHYSHSNNAEKAIEYLGRAAQQALQRSAHADAIRNLTTALELVQKRPDDPARFQRELALQLPLAQALQVVRGYTAEEVKGAFARARSLCERLGDPPQLFRVLYGIGAVHLLRGERRESHRVAKQLLLQAEDTRDSAQLLIAHAAVGITSFEFGTFLSVREHLEAGISFYDRDRHRPLGLDDFLVQALSYLALTLSILGYPDQARKRSEQAIALGRECGPFMLAFATHFYSFVCAYRRETHAAQEAAELVIKLSIEHGFAFFLAQATSLHGEAIASQRHTEEGIAEMLKGLASMRAVGLESNRPMHLARLAKAYGQAGRLDEALRTLQEALAIASRDDERKYACERLQLKGELLLKQSDTNAADAQLWFERAIETSRSQGAKWFELLATMSFARLLVTQGLRAQARAMLAEIYNWFTEGFDTADLKDARALLEELSNSP
jgi:class 3 adenylate cyclase/predicted ATPase